MNPADLVVNVETFLLFLINISPLMLVYRLLFFLGLSISRGCTLLFTLEFQTGNAGKNPQLSNGVYADAAEKTKTFEISDSLSDEEAPSGMRRRAMCTDSGPVPQIVDKDNNEIEFQHSLVENPHLESCEQDFVSHFTQLESCYTSDSSCSPLPPPPPSAPGAKGYPMQSLLPGVPPPPPPPPGPPPPPHLGKGGAVGAPKRRCKKLSWKALSLTQENTIWRKINAKLSTLNSLVDEEDIIEKFTDDKSKRRLPSTDTKKEKPVKQSILEEKKALNLAIALAHAGVTIHRLKKALEDMDGSHVNGDFFQTVYPFLPSTKEIAAVTEKYSAKDVVRTVDQRLSSPEEFALVLSTVKDYRKRIRGLVFQHCFRERIGNLETNMSIIYKAACEVRSSKRLEGILMYVLSTGNIMNGSSTTGFGLELLTKIGDIKTPDRTTSVLMYIVTQIRKKESDLVNLKDDLPNLENTTKVTSEEIDRSFSELAAEFLAVEQDTAGIVQASDFYKDFLQSAKKDMTALKKMRKETNNALKEMVTYLGENPNQVKPRDIFNILRQFIADIGSTIECLERKQRRRVQETRRKTGRNGGSKSAKGEEFAYKVNRPETRRR